MRHRRARAQPNRVNPPCFALRASDRDAGVQAGKVDAVNAAEDRRYKTPDQLTHNLRDPIILAIASFSPEVRALAASEMDIWHVTAFCDSSGEEARSRRKANHDKGVANRLSDLLRHNRCWSLRRLAFPGRGPVQPVLSAECEVCSRYVGRYPDIRSA